MGIALQDAADPGVHRGSGGAAEVLGFLPRHGSGSRMPGASAATGCWLGAVSHPLGPGTPPRPN